MAIALLTREVRPSTQARSLIGSNGWRVAGLKSTQRVLARGDLAELLAVEDELAVAVQRKLSPRRNGRQVGPGHRPTGGSRVLKADFAGVDQHRSLEPVKAIARWYAIEETSLEELILQLYFGPVSLAEVQSLTSSLWGCKNGSELVGDAAGSVVEHVDRYSSRPIKTLFRYVYLQSVEIRRHWMTDRRVSRLASAIGINENGFRELLGVVVEPEDSGKAWDLLLADLVERGVQSPHLVVIENDDAVRMAVKRHWRTSVLLGAAMDLERELLQRVKSPDYQAVVDVFAALKACATRVEGEHIVGEFIGRLKVAGYATLSAELRTRLPEQLAYLDFPREHWPRLREEKVRRSVLFRVREQLRMLGPVMDDQRISRLAVAAFRHEARTVWNLKPILIFGTA